VQRRERNPVVGSMSSLRLLAAFGLLVLVATTAPERIGVIPRQWLIERFTVTEAEARHVGPPDQPVPELKNPFMNNEWREWENLKRRIQPGDELWTWAKRTWPGYGGIALVRNRVVVETIMTWIH
jgi:hypothetical protein